MLQAAFLPRGAVDAPRQMGKTTALQALTRELSAAGGRVALYLSCESAAAVGDDYAARN